MKKILVLVALIAISACGVQRPRPLTISLVTPSGDPLASQGGMKVTTESIYNVKVDWDISDINAYGIKIVAARATDYDCDEPIATATLWGVPNSSTNNTNIMYQNLGRIFERSGVNLSVFTAGEYALCLVATQYDRESSPSIPVFMYLTVPQAATGAMGFYPTL